MKKSKKRCVVLGNIILLSLIISFLGMFLFSSKNTSKLNETDEKAKIAYEYLLTSSNLSSAQVIGIISNIKQQSNFDTSIHQNDSLDSVGLMSWSLKRAVALEDFATQQEKPVDDFYVQLDYILEELSCNSSNFQLLNHKEYTIDDWNSVTNPVKAACILETLYIRPSITTHQVENIARYYAKFL